MTVTCEKCKYASTVILEEFASGPGIIRRYRAKGGTAGSGKEVLTAALANDQIAVEVVKTAGEALGIGVSYLVNALDPEAVIVGGGLGVVEGVYWDAFLERLRSHIWADETRDLPIMHSAMHNDTGLLGAAALALNIR